MTRPRAGTIDRPTYGPRPVRARHAPAALVVLLSTAVCASSSQTTDRGSVAVILEPQDVGTPPSKDKVCRYSSKMISACEFQLALLEYPDPEAAIAEIGAAYTATQDREHARTKDCITRAMTEQQSREAWTCLESLTDCSQLPRCVGPDYHAHPANGLRLKLLPPE